MESPEAKYLFDALTRDMNRLEGLSIDNMNSLVVDDGVMAECIPSLSACTCMRKLNLSNLDLCTNSCSALSAVIPQMAALLELDLSQNSIDDDCIEFIARALAKCGYLQKLDLGFNRISDDGLDVLVQRLPRSVRNLHLNSNRIGDDGLDALVRGLPTNVRDLSLCNNRIGDDGLDTLVRGLPTNVRALSLSYNQVTLGRQLSLLRFKEVRFSGNTLSPGGPQVIADSLADPKCRLETLALYGTSIGDEGMEILASSLRSNRRLTRMLFDHSHITERVWNAFSSILCDTASINATYGSNHTLEKLGYYENVARFDNAPRPAYVNTMLDLNSGEDKSRVAANKILQTHRHLSMRPLFDKQFDLLPYVVAWLDRFAESDLKLSSIFEFARAMPMVIVEGVAVKKKAIKRRRSSS